MTSWARIILENHASESALAPRLERLFKQQQQQWGMLREGQAALTAIRTKTLASADAHILVQANPGRKWSTHARIDAHTLTTRRCFLCPENMPAEERGIGLGKLIILPNPYPILHRHCTVPDRTHRPQQLTGRITEMLELARALGSGMLVFYNGPRCGASAPEHFHFQACAAAGIPLLRELPWPRSGPWQQAFTSLERKILLLADNNADRIRLQLEHALTVLGRLTSGPTAPADEEPMFNLMALVRDGLYGVILFPRAAHRSSCYFSSGDVRLAISPATLEMAGILVVAEPQQLNRVDVKTAAAIYREVSLDETRFNRLLGEIT